MLHPHWLRLASLTLIFPIAGCYTVQRTGKCLLITSLWLTFKIIEDSIDGDDDDDDSLNQLWLEGHGYNNPNPERKKKGLPPLNFDGSPTEDEECPPKKTADKPTVKPADKSPPSTVPAGHKKTPKIDRVLTPKPKPDPS